MGTNIAKTPLTALVYAALLCFVTVFLPFSENYAQARAAFSMPVTGYVFMIAYGLWISLSLAVLFGSVKSKGAQLLAPVLLPLLGAQWILPLLGPVILGEPAGVMSRGDLLFTLGAGCVVSMILLVLSVLLFQTAQKPQPAKPVPDKPAEKYKLKTAQLAVKLLVLPVIYCVIYFLLWYFLLWRAPAVRAYYSGGAEPGTFLQAMINILITNPAPVSVALLKGLLYALVTLPLLMKLKDNRGMFIVICVMLFASGGLLMLIPTPVMPDAVRMAHLLEMSAVNILYAVICSFMLHTGIRKEIQPPPPPPAARTAAGRSPAAARPASTPGK